MLQMHRGMLSCLCQVIWANLWYKSPFNLAEKTSLAYAGHTQGVCGGMGRTVSTVFVVLFSILYFMQILNLPNKITLGRIALVPLVLVLMAFGTKLSCLFAAFFFGLAAFSDLIDGYLARKANQITNLGKFLDPLADKVLVSSVLIMMVEKGWVAAWLVIVIICRDLFITGLRAVASDHGIVIAADRLGKLKTVVQIASMIPLLIHYPLFGLPLATVGLYGLYVAVFLTVYSGIHYFVSFFRVFTEQAHQ